MNFLVSLVVSGLVVLATSSLVTGVQCDGLVTAMLVALVYSVLSTFLAIPVFLAALPTAFAAGAAAPLAGPLLVFVLAIFVTAGASLLIADWLLAGFTVSGWSGAVVACIVMAFLKAILYAMGILET